jgi:SAM-dependent methyltransferase
LLKTTSEMPVHKTPKTAEAYDRDAESLAARYESRTFEEIHGDVLDLVPSSASLILDVGAGSGRDAAWFAAQGHEVVAVEPASRMRKVATSLHPDSSIRWVDDQLPTLDNVFRTGLTFDLIWLSAVWMHVPPTSRRRAFRKMATLIRPGGRIMVSLRQGPRPDDRKMYATHLDEVETLARDHGLAVIRVTRASDRLARKGVTWQTAYLQAPDDGLGALPLLRHVIVNDSKASTYKLALLRVLVRIADSATGLVKDVDDDTVAVPLGLVALYWIRAFKPLVEQGLPQKPLNRNDTGLGFVKDGFHALRQMSPYSLRLGARFTGREGSALRAALQDARNTIVRMPAHYITYPGKEEQVFVAESARPPRAGEFALDAPFLRAFGRLLVPRHLWQAMSRYAAWIEPALLNEWTKLMRSYEGDAKRTHDEHFALLRWLDPEHDTRLVRNFALKVRERNQVLYCLWSGRRLRDEFAIDHCLPFAAWPCNDLWNLFPSFPSVNQRKGDKLPSAQSLIGARDRILEWWETAYVGQDAMRERFVDEAVAALPGTVAPSASPLAEDIFDGLMLQRATLKRDQQLAEWVCC